MTRSEALARGENKYIGRPCRRGHMGVRYTRGGRCVDCEAARERQENRENHIARTRRWRAYRKEELNMWYGSWKGRSH